MVAEMVLQDFIIYSSILFVVVAAIVYYFGKIASYEYRTEQDKTEIYMEGVIFLGLVIIGPATIFILVSLLSNPIFVTPEISFGFFFSFLVILFVGLPIVAWDLLEIFYDTHKMRVGLLSKIIEIGFLPKAIFFIILAVLMFLPTLYWLSIEPSLMLIWWFVSYFFILTAMAGIFGRLRRLKIKSSRIKTTQQEFEGYILHETNAEVILKTKMGTRITLPKRDIILIEDELI
ncbi:MAG: hypothetical protein PHQ80_03890 [Candidatus ainarchaeum sp.]|nr:hypothetical protein [Candidatus ainarchaeum sp.]